MLEAPLKPPPRFCAAPWLESVLYNDGAYRICSRNSRVFGDWREGSLEEAWKSEGLASFRRKISAGEYPDADCAACHGAGTSQTLERVLTTPLENALRSLVQGHFIVYEEYLDLQKIARLFPAGTEAVAAEVGRFEELVKFLLFRFRLQGHGAQLGKLKMIQNILRIVKAYHEGDERPPLVAPFRQVQLIAKCNARCVMCPGKFSGEIESGGAIAPGELELALAGSEQIVDFFCNGSEFLLFPGWKEVALRLKRNGVACLRLSTNGMLLTKGNVDFLVEQGVVGHLNVSFNAGTKETLERVQKNVRWEKLLQNVGYLIEAAESKGVHFPLSFSFIVMRSNLRELPDFFRLVAKWKRICSSLHPHALVMSLENSDEQGYQGFLAEEHPSFAPRAEIEAAFREAGEVALREGVAASLYNFGRFKTLAEFVAAGFPLPEYFPRRGESRAFPAAPAASSRPRSAPSSLSG
jgi:hypothetical protein